MRVKVKGKYYRLNTRNIKLAILVLAFLLLNIWLVAGLVEGVSLKFDHDAISWWNPLHIRYFLGIE